MLFIEYDVAENGEIELVALINAVEQDGEDPDGDGMDGVASRARRQGPGLCRRSSR